MKSNFYGTGLSGLGNLTVRKVDAGDNNLLLAGAEFELFHVPSQVVIATGETGEDGELEFTNLIYGEYEIREVSAPDGYVIRETLTPVEIDELEKEIDILNDKIIRDVRLLKIDSFDEDKFLQGARFELQDRDGNVIEINGDGIYTTDENGVIYIENLDSGQYQFVEIEAAQYYQLDPTPILFEIEAEQITVTEVTTENDLISVALTKVDEFDNSLLLEGATFRLERIEDEVVTIINGDLITNQDGRIEVAGLEHGDYRFIEIEAPEHYVPDGTPIKFTVVPSQEQTEELVKTNQLIPGSVHLEKIDRSTGEPLEGAVFDLVYVGNNDNVILAGLKTDQDGLIIVDDLRPGTYRFVEVEPPAGYRIPQNTDFVVIIEKGSLTEEGELDGSLSEIEISNTKIPVPDEPVITAPEEPFEVKPDLERYAPLPVVGPAVDDPKIEEPVDEPEEDDEPVALPLTGGFDQAVLIAIASLCLLLGVVFILRKPGGYISKKND